MRRPVPAALPVVLAALALVSGCAVGPNFRGPAPPTVEGYARPSLAPATAAVDIAGGEQQRLAPEGDVPHDWWTLFRSSGLTRLVDQALRASPTLVASQQALRQAMELVAAQRGAFFPTVQGSFSPSYQRVSKTLANPLAEPDVFRYSLYTSQVTVTFAPDVFGGNRRQVEAVLGRAAAQRLPLEGA